jgi:predicted nucleic acid-binding protein
MARSEGLWLDCDVLLDWLSGRQPWVVDIAELIRRSVAGEWSLWISPLTLANVHYIYRKHDGSTKSLAAIRNLTLIANLATMDSTHVLEALASERLDFEDELQIACASCVPGLVAIITRNLPDYGNSPIPAMTARAWLDAHPAVA